MADENEGGENENENEGGKGGSGSGSEARFTQDDLTRIGTREKDQGRKAGVREVLDTLGFSSMEEAKQFAADMKAAGDAQLSEAQRTQRQAEEAQRNAERAQNEAKKERFDAKVERKLLRADADPDRLGKLSKLVEADVDSSEEEIDSAIEDLKKDFPELFAAEKSGEENEEEKNGAPGSQSGTTPPPRSDPGRAPGTQQKGSATDRAKSRLEQRHGGRLARNKS